MYTSLLCCYNRMYRPTIFKMPLILESAGNFHDIGPRIFGNCRSCYAWNANYRSVVRTAGHWIEDGIYRITWHLLLICLSCLDWTIFLSHRNGYPSYRPTSAFPAFSTDEGGLVADRMHFKQTAPSQPITFSSGSGVFLCGRLYSL